MSSIPGMQLVIPGPNWTFPPILPCDEVKIWRYLSLAKLASLLQTQALYLSRADMLGDPFEGAWSDAAIESFKTNATDDYIEKALLIHRVVRRRSWVSCWHVSEQENEALWRLYSPDSQGVAIQSTVGCLTKIVPAVSPNSIAVDEAAGTREIELSAVSEVHYVDYSTEGPHLNNTIGPLICKRKAFAHEKEVRAIVQSLPLGERGRGVNAGAPEGALGLLKPIDIEYFIKHILVDPLAPDWIVSVVENIVRRYGYKVPVIRSQLGSKPYM